MHFSACDRSLNYSHPFAPSYQIQIYSFIFGFTVQINLPNHCLLIKIKSASIQPMQCIKLPSRYTFHSCHHHPRGQEREKRKKNCKETRFLPTLSFTPSSAPIHGCSKTNTLSLIIIFFRMRCIHPFPTVFTKTEKRKRHPLQRTERSRKTGQVGV